MEEVIRKIRRRKIRKIKEYKWIAGICAGAAYWLGIPVWIIRIMWLCSVLFYGFGTGVYILLFIFLPKWDKTPTDFKKITGD